MEKESICIIDYIGNSKSNGEPVGHPIKVINEYYYMLKDTIDNIYLLIPQNYKKYCNAENVRYLRKYCDVTTKSILQRVFNIMKKLINIRDVFKQTKSNILWFINTDPILYFFLFLYPGRVNKKVFVTTYVGEYSDGNKITNKIKNFVLKKGLNKVDIVITPNNYINLKGKEVLKTPDYFFIKDKYSSFLNINKKDQVVCLGTMNDSKQLKELIEIFNKTRYPLIIKGHFFDKNVFNTLSKNINDNILLEDVYLNDTEYYNLLSESKFVILPYNMSYKQRSSGVLLESIFCNTIPIAPSSILGHNNIDGVGYNDIFDLLNVRLNHVDIDKFYSYLKELRENRYSYDLIKEKLVEKIHYYIK